MLAGSLFVPCNCNVFLTIFWGVNLHIDLLSAKTHHAYFSTVIDMHNALMSLGVDQKLLYLFGCAVLVSSTYAGSHDVRELANFEDESNCQR